MRVGEAQGLKVSDVDFTGKSLQIQRTVSGRHKAVTFTTGKTDAAQRTVPLPDSLLESLRVWLARVDAERMQAASSWQEQGLLFPFGGGDLVPYSKVRRDLELICRDAQLELITAHDLRRTFITLAIQQGTPPELVAKIVGHTDIAMTLSVYRKVAKSEIKSFTLEL